MSFQDLFLSGNRVTLPVLKPSEIVRREITLQSGEVKGGIANCRDFFGNGGAKHHIQKKSDVDGKCPWVHF